jgi:hypothetical protein
MGGDKYSFSSRLMKSESLNYASAPVSKLFSQTEEKKIHQSMDPKRITIREARDSEINPNSFPIILALDVTGSMSQIPIWLVREGLPKVMDRIIQKGVPDPALLFIAIGDAEKDKAPLQVGQFESGDDKLDHWLQSVWLEGGGGGNDGESYSLAWYFAGYHTVTDSFEKRRTKGILFTTGDEPCLDTLTKHHLHGLMENASSQHETFDAKTLLAKAQEQWEVYHLHVMQGSAGRRSLAYWQQLLGDHCIQVDEYKNLPEIMSQIIFDNYKKSDSVNNNFHEETAENIDGVLPNIKTEENVGTNFGEINML